MAKLKRQASELSGGEDRRPGDLAGLEDSLDAAIGSLWIAYQPIVSARTAEVFGYEALLRSRESRLPDPGSILEAAVKLNRLEELSRSIREQAMAPFTVTAESRLFLNLHPRDLLDEHLCRPDSPLAQIAEKVVLEVTERESLDRIPQLQQKLDSLRGMGFAIAIDDLGAGYAGLSAFAALKPRLVKLDISLISHIDSSAIKRRLVRSMVETCHDFDILVVAEGIETQAEMDACVEVGCDLLQGFLLARPGPAFPDIDESTALTRHHERSAP